MEWDEWRFAILSVRAINLTLVVAKGLAWKYLGLVFSRKVLFLSR